MKNAFFTALAAGLFGLAGCVQNSQPSASGAASAAPSGGAGQSAVVDDVSKKDVVKVAVASKDHTTLVAAVQAADLVNSLSNAGPFTVFAPTNAAFSALPAGTVEGLLKPEKKADLQAVLQYHVLVGAMKTEQFRDGQTIGTVEGPNIVFHVKDGKTMVNDATILGSVEASNGIVHVIDKVLLPPAQ